MPRIRTIKPEFFSDEKVGRLSIAARLFCIGCLTQADDEGILRWNADFLRGALFPYDRHAHVASYMKELIDSGIIIQYTTNSDNSLAIFRHFRQHQVIDRPSQSHNQLPTKQQFPEFVSVFDKKSSSPQRGLDEPSLPETEGEGRGGETEGIRTEEIRKENGGDRGGAAASAEQKSETLKETQGDTPCAPEENSSLKKENSDVENGDNATPVTVTVTSPLVSSTTMCQVPSSAEDLVGVFHQILDYLPKNRGTRGLLQTFGVSLQSLDSNVATFKSPKQAFMAEVAKNPLHTALLREALLGVLGRQYQVRTVCA